MINMALDKISYLTKRKSQPALSAKRSADWQAARPIGASLGEEVSCQGAMKELQILISYTHDTFILYTRY